MSIVLGSDTAVFEEVVKRRKEQAHVLFVDRLRPPARNRSTRRGLSAVGLRTPSLGCVDSLESIQHVDTPDSPSAFLKQEPLFRQGVQSRGAEDAVLSDTVELTYPAFIHPQQPKHRRQSVGSTSANLRV